MNSYPIMLKESGNSLRIFLALVLGIPVLACADKVEDVSLEAGLAPAIGQCIEVIHPFRIFRGYSDGNADLLVVFPEGSSMERTDGNPYPAGERIEISRFVAIDALDGSYFFVYGKLQGGPGSREFNLVQLTDVEWLATSAEQLSRGIRPILPISGEVPLDLSNARPCVNG